MRRILLVFTIAISGLIWGSTKTDKNILDKVVFTLNAIKTVEYQTIIHSCQKTMGTNSIDTAICYFDFTGNDSLIGAKYQFNFKNDLQVYNGSQTFDVDKSAEKIIYSNDPGLYDATCSIAMMNSIWSIKKLLPKLLKDTAVVISREKDTIINGENNYVFKITIKNRYIDIGALLTENKKGIDSNYNLCISTKTYLPTEFITVEKDGFLSSSFSGYDLHASRPDSIWNMELFPQKYLRISDKEFAESFRKAPLVQIGKKAIDWRLPMVNSKDSVQLSKLKGNLILMEFWFPGCGGCVAAIPEINRINNEYSNKGLQIYGIEFTKPNDTGLKEYIKEHKIEYPTLHTGKVVAGAYGVIAAPTFYLIDKNGVIKYASAGLRQDELRKSIEENLK
jgi:peroxiredoxin